VDRTINNHSDLPKQIPEIAGKIENNVARN